MDIGFFSLLFILLGIYPFLENAKWFLRIKRRCQQKRHTRKVLIVSKIMQPFNLTFMRLKITPQPLRKIFQIIFKDVDFNIWNLHRIHTFLFRGQVWSLKVDFKTLNISWIKKKLTKSCDWTFEESHSPPSCEEWMIYFHCPNVALGLQTFL